MLIVCTKDPTIVRTAQDPRSGSPMWGTLVILDPRFNQAQATAQMQAALRAVGRTEPVCFSAHGNDDEIGDAGSGPGDWGWSRDQIALMLQDAMPPGFAGPILIHACAESVSNFSAGLAVALERIRALNGVWIYGYQRAVPASAGYPDPRTLDRNVELYGTQVNYRLAHDAAPGAEPDVPSAVLHPPPHGHGAHGNGVHGHGAHGNGAHGNGAGHAGRYHASFPGGCSLDIPVGFDPDEVRRLIQLVAERTAP